MKSKIINVLKVFWRSGEYTAAADDTIEAVAGGIIRGDYWHYCCCQKKVVFTVSSKVNSKETLFSNGILSKMIKQMNIKINQKKILFMIQIK